jgi:hypothetical protein
MILASRELFKDLSRRWVEIARTESIEAPASRAVIGADSAAV